MSNRGSLALLLFSLSWIDPAAAQVGSQDSPSWVLSVREGQLTADINRIPLRLVLEELARHVPLRVSMSLGLRDKHVTASFRTLPLDEAITRLLAGYSFAIIHARAPEGAGPGATGQIGELIVLGATPAAGVAGGGEPPVVAGSTGFGPRQETTLDTTPEWTAVLQHPDPEVRLEALGLWAEQGTATPLDPLTHALVDPNEAVRARAQELVEQVWAAKAEAEAR